MQISRQNQTLAIGVWIVIAWFSPLAQAAPQQSPRGVTIQVLDPSGTPIPHAQIRITPVPDPLPAKMETNDRGELSLNLKPALYKLSVSASGFKNWSESIYVSGEKGETPALQVYQVVLDIGSTSGPIVVYPPDSLVLSADNYHAPVALTAAEFHALPRTAITVHNSHTDADETYTGVPLASLLAMVHAPLGQDLRKEAMANYVIASAKDQYTVVLSLAEIDPSFHAGQVFVVDERDGKPLGKSGPFQLIVSDDKRPARWVHNLVSISVQSSR